MQVAGVVDLGLVLAWDVGRLGARQDVEVVVGCVAAGVAFCADCGACRGGVSELWCGDVNRGKGGGGLPKMIRYSVMLA